MDLDNFDSYNLPGVKVKPYFDSLTRPSDVVRAGFHYALLEDKTLGWEVIDNVVAPTYARKVKGFYEGESSKEKWRAEVGIAEQLLKSKDSRVRDFAATLLCAYFEFERPSLSKRREGISIDPRTQKASLVDSLLDVALNDTELWPRVLASMALTSAHKLMRYEPFTPEVERSSRLSKIEQHYDKLRTNLETGCREDPPFASRIQPYLDLIQKQ